MSEKPRHRLGYSLEELDQVKAACLTVAVTLGAHLDDVCIVGGIVPALIIDSRRSATDGDERHPGTNDLDIGLALAVLEEQRYTEISARLRAEGFKADANAAGNPTVQRWRLGELNVTVDFLIPPHPGQDDRVRVHNLEGDFGALVTPGLQLAFEERTSIELDGHTLRGEPVRRAVPVCGPAAFVVLKALAFGDRGEPKDAYDLVYVLRHAPARGEDIGARLAAHADRYRGIVARALGLLARDFARPDGLGPTRVARFTLPDPPEPNELDAARADAHGYVDDLLRAGRELGLTTERS